MSEFQEFLIGVGSVVLGIIAIMWSVVFAQIVLQDIRGESPGQQVYYRCLNEAGRDHVQQCDFALEKMGNR